MQFEALVPTHAVTPFQFDPTTKFVPEAPTSVAEPSVETTCIVQDWFIPAVSHKNPRRVSTVICPIG